MKLKLKKGDEIQVMAGKDRGKTGRILRLIPARERLIVEGVNQVKKHKKPTQKSKGGIEVQEAAFAISNAMLLCPLCKKAARIGIRVLPSGEHARFCKKCKQTLDK
jgi:large subunit ribosomal protein L24